jgi:hypothetical protein
MSRATSFASMAQQLSLSVGVGTGALLLHVTVTLRGAAVPGAVDFAPAFLVVGAVAALSALVYLPLPPDAGAEISGRGHPPERAEAAPAGGAEPPAAAGQAR